MLPNDSFANAKEYLKWISYIPEHWNIDKILEKKQIDLLSSKLKLLKFIKREKMLRNILIILYQ